MRTLVLAAGFGTRLRPLTDHTPKALVDVCGMSILERNLRFFQRQRMTPLAVNTHYMHERFEAFRAQSGIDFHLSHEREEIRGSGGALYAAREWLGREDAFCVANAEPLTELDMAPLVETFLKRNCLCALVAAAPRGCGTLVYEPDSGKLCGPTRTNPPRPNDVTGDFVGVALYRREFLELLDESVFNISPIWRRAAQTPLDLTAGKPSGACVLQASPRYYRDIGAPGELAQVHFDALRGELELEFPEHFVWDRRRAVAYPRQASPAVVEALEELTWCDAETVPPGCTFRRCVVYANARLTPGKRYENVIVTSQGSVELD